MDVRETNGYGYERVSLYNDSDQSVDLYFMKIKFSLIRSLYLPLLLSKFIEDNEIQIDNEQHML
jgi:hypothetical protein